MSVRYSEVSAIEYVRKTVYATFLNDSDRSLKQIILKSVQNLFCIRILFFFGWASAYSYILYRNFLVLEVKVAAFEMNNYLYFKVNIIAEFF